MTELCSICSERAVKRKTGCLDHYHAMLLPLLCADGADTSLRLPISCCGGCEALLGKIAKARYKVQALEAELKQKFRQTPRDPVKSEVNDQLPDSKLLVPFSVSHCLFFKVGCVKS